MTYCNTLKPRNKQETLLRRCTKPNTDGLAKESHFRAAYARYASASLVEMQKSPRLEPSLLSLDAHLRAAPKISAKVLHPGNCKAECACCSRYI